MTATTYSDALRALVHAAAAPTHKLLWKVLPPADRKQAVRLLLEDAESPWARAVLVDFAAKVNPGFRRQTVAGWPLVKLVDEVAKRPLDDVAMITTLIQSLHFPERAGLQVAFFDACGIAHQNGTPTDEALPTPAAAPETAAAAARTLLAQQPGDAALYYLLCVAVLEPAAWPGLRESLREVVPAA